MKYLVALVLVCSVTAEADSTIDLNKIAMANGYKVSEDVLVAIIDASKLYQVDAKEMLVISLIESSGGKNAKTRTNRNMTQDIGVFQINTVNKKFCSEFNLNNVKGNAMCAAKLLNRIKSKHKGDKEAVARYHSNTRIHKDLYFGKIQMMLAVY